MLTVMITRSYMSYKRLTAKTMTTKCKPMFYSVKHDERAHKVLKMFQKCQWLKPNKSCSPE